MRNMPRMDGSRLGLTYDCRWSMADWRGSPLGGDARGRSGKAILRDAHAINKGLTDREMAPNGVPGLASRDVKNEDRSGHVHENKRNDDNMSLTLHAFYKRNADFARELTGIPRPYGQKMRGLRDKLRQGGIWRVCRSAIISLTKPREWAGTPPSRPGWRPSRVGPNSYSWRLQSITHSTIYQKQVRLLICGNMSWRVICLKPKEIACLLRIGAKLGARHSTMY